MTDVPRVSVVLPVHNGIRFLDEAVKSVLGQTLRDWELILVNDASTDASGERVDHWAGQDPRIHAIHLERNRKLPGALNEGFLRARAGLFTWTSDDNWYSPDALERMVALLDARPEVDVVYARSTEMDAAGMFVRYPPSHPPEDLAVTNCVGACFLYRREVHEALSGYDETLFLAEDYDFWLRAYLDFRFAVIDSLLYFYRLHDKSLTETRKIEISLATEKALLRWVKHRDKLNRRLRGRAYEAMGNRALIRGDLWHARRLLLRAACLLLRPPLFHKCRSYAVDCFFGRRLGQWVRGRRRTTPGTKK